MGLWHWDREGFLKQITTNKGKDLIVQPHFKMYQNP